MASVSVSQSELNKISSAISDSVSEFEKTIATGLENYVEVVNKVWCSPTSQTFNNKVKEAIDEVTTGTQKVITDLNDVYDGFTADYSKLNDVSYSWQTVSQNTIDAGALSSLNQYLPASDGVDDRQGFVVGEEGSYCDAFNKIIDCLNNYMDKLSEEVKKNKAYSDEENRNIAEALNTVKDNALESFQELQDQLNNVIGEEAETYNSTAAGHTVNVSNS